MLDKEGQERTFKQLMELFVIPEIARRKETGGLLKNFVLNKAQVIFDDEGEPSVRLNEETKIVAKVKLKSGVKKNKDEAVFENEIERIENLQLLDEEEPKYAHVSMVRYGNRWLLAFDFRYNKDLARDHFETARQFYKSAQDAYKNKLLAPFIDNLFSCIELLAKSELLLIPDSKFRRTAKHRAIQSRYNQFMYIDKDKLGFRTALNELSKLRNSARYLKPKALSSLEEDKAQDYLTVARAWIDYLEQRLEKH